MNETITVVGNITEPEFKVTPNGVEIINFRIASTERRYDKVEEKWGDGATSWYSVSAFRRLAAHAHRSFRKGDRVMVTGRLRMRDWETPVKKGVTAEIDADALGHDLLWGTTTFHRDGAQGRPTTPDTANSPWTVGEAPATSEWATRAPGTEADQSGDDAVAAAGAAEADGAVDADERADRREPADAIAPF